MLTVFWDSEGVQLAYFQKCGNNVNSALHCEVLLRLQDSNRRKRPGQLLHHDNARPHTAQSTQERIQEPQWELLYHPPYSPDLAPSDFHLFDPVKTTLVANISLMTKRLKQVRKWLRQQSKDFWVLTYW
jgi:histone-lysine N-methyltransferase SETMAR